ncbi:RNA polymerase sigma-70 factor [Zavarzinia sp. CC-PAN008]|uniref:RNA polymerase sigma-70 factor n=1 Tax=Zavarzinia sp. CC-PAN008 TaxID=3243332 RepID=UPI003F74AC45
MTGGHGQAEAIFAAHRRLLRGIAYRMLGSMTEAEDVVQDAWLRWDAADRHAIDEPRAWLVTTATRLAIDQLRRARARREDYVGPWLPEPVSAEAVDGPDRQLEGRESISMALLLLLERLSPDERAAFLLHEVFDYDYAQIAAILERSEAACRQLVSRGRGHVRAGRPRFQPSMAEQQRLAGLFAAAAAGGDMAGLMAVLAPDAVLLSDGGGKVRAALNPILGAERSARFLLGVLAKWPSAVAWEMAMLNGAPSLVGLMADGAPMGTLAFDFDGERIVQIHIVTNPDKLRHLWPRSAEGATGAAG